MALPIRPGNGGLPVARPAAPLPDLGALPDLTETRPESIQAPPARTPAPAAPAQRPISESPKRAAPQSPAARAPQESEQRKPLPAGYAVDPVTGKRYKKLPGFKEGVMSSKAAVKAASNGGMTLDQLRATVREDPDLNPDDLNGAAELFMAHLRVPPDKEEQKKLLAERAKRESAFKTAHERVIEDEPVEEDDF